METYKVEYLKLPNGKAPIIEWLESLDKSFKRRILQGVLRIEEGNFGDFKKIDSEISELRFTFGKGYRIYCTQINDIIVLLINGGDKSNQQSDIKKAKELLNEWRLNQ